MYFLIGLGIILAIVYGNMLYDYIKGKKGDKDQEAEKAPASPKSREKSNQEAAHQLRDSSASSLFLADIIEKKLKEKQHIFGLPLTLCESDGQGKLVTLDQEDNIYVIETVIRPGHVDFNDQVMEDMAAERRRISRKTGERRVYAIICTDHPSESLKAFVEMEKGIRLFCYDIVFNNIM